MGSLVTSLALVLVGAGPEPVQAEPHATAGHDEPRAGVDEPVPPGVPLTIGYYGSYIIQPGLRVGVFTQPWSRVVTPRVGRPRRRTDGIFVAPHVAVFGRPHNHWSVMADAEIGYRGLRHRSNLYSAWSVDLAYLLELQVTAISVDLGTGDKSRTREARHYVVPTLNYEFGQEYRRNVGWYVQLGAGYRMGNVEGALYIALGAGLRARIPARGRNG